MKSYSSPPAAGWFASLIFILLSALADSASAAPPVNDSFASAGTLTGLPVTGTGSNVDATREAAEPDPSSGAGQASVWWNWTALAAGWVEVNTLTSGFDTILAVYTGNVVNGLSLVAWNDQAGTSDQSRVKLLATAGMVYRIQVMGWEGSTGPVALAVKSTIAPQPPVLQRLTLTPPSVNVTTGDATLSAELEFLSPNTLDYVDLGFRHPGGSEFFAYVTGLVRVSGTLEAGVYRGQVTVPARRVGGTWQVSAWLYDGEGDGSTYGTPGGPSLPAGSTSSVTVINTAEGDVSAPVLTGAQVSPDPVDVSLQSGQVTVRLTASDDTAVTALSVGFTAEGPGYVAFLALGQAELVSGTAASGTWEKTLTIPAFSAPAVWKLNYSLTDAAGRTTVYDAAAAPLPAGLPGFLTIQNMGLVDSAGPIAGQLSTSTSTVDISQSAQMVGFQATLTDSPAGLRSASVSLYGPSGSLVGNAPLYLKAAAPFPDGPVPVSATLTIPRYLAPGTYHWELTAYDADFRLSSYGGSGTAFPSGFTGLLTVLNSGAVDLEEPVAARLTVSPDTLGTADLPAVIEVSVQGVDDAGVTAVALVMDAPDGGERRVFPLMRTSGTPADGSWTGRLVLREDYGEGSWQIGVQLEDVAGRKVLAGPFSDAQAELPEGAPAAITISQSPQPNAYGVWRNTRPALAGAEGDAAADPDGDGYANALEFLWGTDPLLGSGPNGPDPEKSRAALLSLTENQFRVDYQLSATNAAAGAGNPLSFQVQFSQDLSQLWSPLTPVAKPGGGWKVDVPLADGPRGFLRFLVLP